MGHKNKVHSIKDVIRKTGDDNNDLAMAIVGLEKTNTTSRLELVTQKASMISEEMRHVR